MYCVGSLCRKSQASWTIDVSKAIDSIRKEATFLEFESNNCVSKNCEYVSNTFNMFFQKFQKYDAIIKVDNREQLFGNSDANVYCVLKSTRCVP